MSGEHAAVHRMSSIDADSRAIDLMEIRGRLLAYLDVTEVDSPERRYVKQAETLIAAALVNLEVTEDG